ncbi:MAG: glycosyltransferase family 9 protein [Pelagibacteraceae bacterium]|nr:glycosyltransferase family 9 protein [Pelagibacteraceae bacterium]
MLTSNESSKSYAIFARSSYGDLLMTDPLIKYIKNINVNNKITLFVEDKNYQLVEFMENIDCVYKIPSKGNKYLFYIYYGIKYRKQNYDISIAAKTGVGSANGFFQFMLGAKKKISYVSKKRKWTDKLVNYPVTYSEKIYHSQHYALSVLQLLDNNFDQVPKKFYPKLKNNSRKRNTINPKLLLSVSNNRESCTLDNNTTASIINKLKKNFQFDIYISAMPKDTWLAKDLEKKVLQKVNVFITPKLSEFIKLISSMDICFHGEGGGMHIAAALGISQVVLFGHTSTITWAPLSDKSVVLSDRSNVNNIPQDKIIHALKEKIENY